MRRRDLLIHPLFTGALALLALNDHVLKIVASGMVTGKLSDLAGVFVVAIVLFVLCNNRVVALAVTAVGFTAIKLSPVAAGWAEPLLGGTTLQDPWDLVAFAALVPAYLLMLEHVELEVQRSVLRPLVTFASGVAVLMTVTATSCAAEPGVAAFRVDRDRIVARIAGGHEETKWALSTDGGVTWNEVERPVGEMKPTQRDCASDVHCYRVVPDERVLETNESGEWDTSFSFSAEERRRMQLRGTACSAEPPLFAAVATAEVDGEDHVVVAMSDQGVLHRPSSGEWQRLKVLDMEPLPLHGPSWMAKLPLAAFLLMLVSPLLILLSRRRRQWKRGIAAFLLCFLGGLGLAMVDGILLLFGVDYVILGPLIVALCLVVFVLSIAIAKAGPVLDPLPPPPGPPPPPPDLGGRA